jgi:GAF domain-containing protein
MPLEGSPAAVALASRKPLLINPVSLRDDLALCDRGVASMCIPPLVSRDHALGTWNVGSRGESAFAQEDVTLLSQVTNHIGLAVDNARSSSNGRGEGKAGRSITLPRNTRGE